MPLLPRVFALCLALCLPVVLGSCATLQQIANLRNVDFAIQSVNNANLAGVDIDGLRGYEDLSGGETARLVAALARGTMPLSFTLNVGAENPADNPVAARLVRLDWTLLLDNTETISGIFNDEREIAPGAFVTLPITMELDVIDFFGRNIQDIAELAAAVAGHGSKQIALRAQPTVTTPIGPITYPSEITIVRRDVGR